MKIFGLGLSKTATKSLHVALEILGYKSTHWPEDIDIVKSICNGNFRWKIIDENDCLTDIHGAMFYREFDKAYPGSKFILTVREKEAWLNSLRRHHKSLKQERWLQYVENFIKGGELEPLFHMRFIMGFIAWGRLYNFGNDHASFIYDRHVKEVCTYFENRDDFLEIDICGGDGWEKLCPFLEKDVPATPFPNIKDGASLLKNTLCGN